MNGGVGAAAPAAAAGPPPGHSRPPLPRRPPGAHRSLKQREREAPDVEWARALQHFAGCIRADLDDLHRRFIEENVVTFAAWKRLWRDARMSAAFHVEFWESTPTTTHKAILQQALDALVWCIEERGGEFGSEADVAALIGRVFALYCAYSVQLGAPKHKIDVDPQDWTALISVNCVMCGAGATMFPTAAREVRAMMHRLVVQENAFLRCLKGFGPSVRAQDRAERPRGGGGTGAHQDVSSIASSATEEDAIVQQSKLVQLKSLNDRYQEIMSRARSSGAAAVSSSGARLGGRRALPASQRPGSLLQGPGNNGEELIRSLTSYMEYKQNEEARRQDRVARAAAAREEEAKTIPEVLASERDDSTNILALSDRGSVMSAPVSPVAPSVASSRREPRRRLDSEGSEAFLAELESELHADVSSDQVVAPLSALSPRNAATGRHSSAVSEISEADSDALADLERELEQSVDEAPSRAQEEAAPAKTRSPVRRKRGRSAASAGDAPRSTTRTAQASTQESAVVASRPMTERRPRDSTPSRIFVADSWAASSTAESDGLDAIQAELDAIPMATEASESAFFRPVRETNGAAITAAAKPKPKAKEKTRQPAGRANARNKASIAVTNRDQQLAAPPRRETRTRASSIASESSDLVAQLQTELDYPAAPLASTASNAKTSAKGIGPRRSSRLSSVASETGSNALEELERELNASTATLAGAPPLPLARQMETPSRIRGVASSKRPAQPTSSAAPRQTKRAHTTTSASGTVSATQTPSKARGKQQVQSNPVAPQQSTQASAVSSDTESDGLSESMSELDAPVAAKPSPKQKLPTKKPGAKPTARRKPPTSSQLRSRTRRNSSDSEAALAELESKLHGNIASDRAVQQASSATPSTTTAVRSLISVNGIRPRRSSRLSSAASDSGSNALEELERELNASAATLAQAAQPPAANPTKTVPRKRGVASSKRPAHQDLPVARKKARSTTPENSTARREQRGPIIRQQSTRKSAVSSDAESDGLAELMSELETPVASATTPTQRKSPPAKKASSAQPRKTPSSSKAAAARPTPARSKVPPRAAAAAAAATSAAVGPRRSARLSSIASDTESDGLEDLMAELESAQAKEAAADVTQSSAQAVKNKATRAQGAKTDGKQAKRIPKAKTSAPTAPPRQPRTPRAPRPTQPKPSRNAAPQKVAPAAPLSSRRSTRSSSVAFDSDSDGLAELEAELQAGDS